MLKNCASYRSANLSVSLNVLKTLKSKRVWNGPRNRLRPALEKPVSEKSHAAAGLVGSSVVGPQGGTPFVPGALTLIPKALPLSTGLPAFMPVLPCNCTALGVEPGVARNGLVMKSSPAPKNWLATLPEKSYTP